MQFKKQTPENAQLTSPEEANGHLRFLVERQRKSSKKEVMKRI
jgi:hypothetical protein